MLSTRPLEVTFFAICTLFVLIGGVVTVAAKNPIRGAMGLLGTIIGVAGMYLLLSAELLAAVQVVVYAGAVIVLFLFVIMLLGPSASESSDARGAVSRYVAAGLFVAVAAGALFVIMRMGGATLTTLPPASPAMGTIEVIGRELFSKDIVPFEIAGLLLLIAVVGAMAVARGKQGDQPMPDGPKRPRVTPDQHPGHNLTEHETGHPEVGALTSGASKATLPWGTPSPVKKITASPAEKTEGHEAKP